MLVDSERLKWTSEEWKRKRKWELFVADEMPADGDQRGVRARWLGAYANVVEAALALVRKGLRHVTRRAGRRSLLS
jgi:hypothetical protein